jgi:hypothetical protein
MRKLFVAVAAVAAVIPAAPAAARPKASSPAQTCRALRQSMGVEDFRAAYGTNHNQRNAMGKCRSAERHAAHQAKQAKKAKKAHPAHPARSRRHAA